MAALAQYGLLFAPKSGHELRGDIADATRKGIDNRVRQPNNLVIAQVSIIRWDEIALASTTKPLANERLNSIPRQQKK